MVTVLLLAILCANPIAAAQKEVTPADEAAAFKQMVSVIPLGSRVKLQTNSKRRMSATLMAVTDDSIVVKRVTRVPEPALTIAFADLRKLERDEGGGMTIGKAIGIGLAAGAGAIATLFVIMMTIAD